jgi:primosomal protein N'
VTGIVVATRNATDADVAGVPGGLRDVARALDTEAFLPEAVVDLALWVADYYLCAPGEAIAAAMPPLAWVESERRWSLTDEGRAVQGEVRGPRRTLLDALADGRPRDLADLASLLPVPAEAAQGSNAAVQTRLERVLKDLERRGWVSPVQHLVGKADASRMSAPSCWPRLPRTRRSSPP